VKEDLCVCVCVCACVCVCVCGGTHTLGKDANFLWTHTHVHT
jgi:hypothetical protein